MNTLPIAFSTLAFPDATLAEAITLGRSWGYAGVELRLIDGRLIDSSMPPAERVRVKQTIAAAGLPTVSVDSSILLTADDAEPELRRFQVFGPPPGRQPFPQGINADILGGGFASRLLQQIGYFHAHLSLLNRIE